MKFVLPDPPCLRRDKDDVVLPLTSLLSFPPLWKTTVSVKPSIHRLKSPIIIKNSYLNGTTVNSLFIWLSYFVWRFLCVTFYWPKNLGTTPEEWTFGITVVTVGKLTMISREWSCPWPRTDQQRPFVLLVDMVMRLRRFDWRKCRYQEAPR